MPSRDARPLWLEPCPTNQRYRAQEQRMEEFRDERTLEEAILGYLHECPNAMETFEGIAEWWLLRRELRVDLRMLSRVLSRLTANGVLEVTGPVDRQRY